jgi:hypothetical protein
MSTEKTEQSAESTDNLSILDTFDIEEPPSHPGEEPTAEAEPLEGASEDEASDEVAAEVAGESEAAEENEVEPDAAEAAKEETEEASVEPESTEFVDGSAKTRLRDGTEITIAELKKRADGETIREREAKLDAELSQITEQSQSYQKAIEDTVNWLERQLPPEPDQALLDRDPILYLQQKEAHDAAVKRLNHFRQQGEIERAAREQEQLKVHQKWMDEQEKVAKATFPELANPETAKPLLERVRRAPSLFELMPKDVPQKVMSAWEIEVLDAAVRWKELQASKAKVQEKAKKAPPAAAAGRRQSQQERSAHNLQDDLAELRRTGSKKLGEDILSRFA